MHTTLVACPLHAGLKWLYAILVILVLVLAVVIPNYYVQFQERRLWTSVYRQKAVLAGLRFYADEHAGHYPHINPDGTPFTTSTEAFQGLMDTVGIDDEHTFFEPLAKNKTQPNHDGTLDPKENCLSYVTHQNDSMPGYSPLIAQAMIGPGVFGENHPFLSRRRAVVGYIDGHASAEKLNQLKPGATIPGPPGSGIDNIFEPSQLDAEGNIIGGGYLAVPVENILHP